MAHSHYSGKIIIGLFSGAGKLADAQSIHGLESLKKLTCINDRQRNYVSARPINMLHKDKWRF
jgi:hypothetical protein